MLDDSKSAKTLALNLLDECDSHIFEDLVTTCAGLARLLIVKAGQEGLQGSTALHTSDAWG